MMFCRRINEVDSVTSRHVSSPINRFIYPCMCGRGSSVDIRIVHDIKPSFPLCCPLDRPAVPFCSHSYRLSKVNSLHFPANQYTKTSVPKLLLLSLQIQRWVLCLHGTKEFSSVQIFCCTLTNKSKQSEHQ